MGTTLHTLTPNPGANKAKKRLGRGHGSGLHKTSGKGQKGQKARTGHHGIPKPGFEGGQTALARRLPKRGFNNKRFRDEIFAINLGDLSEVFESGAHVDIDAMKSAGLVPRSAEFVKVLADGELAHPLKVTAHYFSAAARERLAALKGSIEEIARPEPYRRAPKQKPAKK
jgi:large subunit ribosomal protein L15